MGEKPFMLSRKIGVVMTKKQAIMLPTPALSFLSANKTLPRPLFLFWQFDPRFRRKVFPITAEKSRASLEMIIYSGCPCINTFRNRLSERKFCFHFT
jgi:hypothetical protein